MRAGVAGVANALLYECFAGISGDMHLGALIDVGVPADHLRRELGRLALADEFELVVESAVKRGVSGTRASVRLAADSARPTRGLREVKNVIDSAGYAPAVRDRAFAMFEAIAKAEAKIHGLPIERVHFHEVGATDSIADIVGAAIGLQHLGVEAAYCALVEVGKGTVRCAHGVFPVPAPATVEILQGVPCHYGGVDGEATTPTGAAILRCVVDAFEPPPAFTPRVVGYGIGQRDCALPNVLRLSLGTVATEPPAATQGFDVETNIEVECNIDDMPAEAFGPLMDALFGTGAKDVFLTPIVMKKARPGTKVSVLVEQDHLDALLAELFHASTTIGVRLREVAKRMLPREETTVATALGDVRVKVVTLPDGSTRWKSEHDDIAAIATRTGGDYLTTKARVDREIARLGTCTR